MSKRNKTILIALAALILVGVMFFYLPQEEAEIKSILGADWDASVNRQKALEIAQAAAEADPKDAFAFFNVGSNLFGYGIYPCGECGGVDGRGGSDAATTLPISRFPAGTCLLRRRSRRKS